MVLQHDAALEGLTVVDIAELQARCQELVDEAVAGDDPVVVTSDGRPRARLERYVPPARAFYVRASPEGDGASERVYREVVETLHRSLTVPEFQACCAELVGQTHANNWTVLIWNSPGPDAMLTRHFWHGQQRSSNGAAEDIDWSIDDVWDATRDAPSPGDEL